MDHFRHIYSHRAADYHPLIAAEDVDGHLPEALRQITAFAGKRVLDLGTGTGRLPLLLAREAGQFVGLDLHAGMLRQNQIERRRVAGPWDLIQGDMRHLPLPEAAFDVITAGWAIGHFTGWYADRWREAITVVLREMQRVARPGAVLLILETLTTGSQTPAPPTPRLGEYYAWLEAEAGFARREFSTDYQFASVEAGGAPTQVFFFPPLSS